MYLEHNKEYVFWYAKKQIVFFATFFFFIVFSVSFLTPPFQSPDEFNHVQRIYLLAKGELRPDADISNSGGYVDNGLLAYMQYFSAIPFHPERKVDAVNYETAKKIKWTHKESFLEFKNSGIYGPLTYLPQSLGLYIGIFFDLTVHNSYRLARFLLLLSALLFVIYASCVFPIPPIALAILLTPISIFQLGTTSPDGICFSLIILSLSLYSKLFFSREPLSKLQWIILSFANFAIITRYFNFMPLVIIPLYLYWLHKKNIFLIFSAFIFSTSLFWILYAFQIHTLPPHSISDVVFYYIKQPLSLMKVFLNTFSRYGTVRNTLYEMIGRLGWNDLKLQGKVFFVLPFFYLIYINVFKQEVNSNIAYKRILILLAASFSFLILLMLLVGWTTHPARVIDGISGRYFVPVLFFLAYAFSDLKRPLKNKKLTYKLLILLMTMSFCIVSYGLRLRYWI